MTGPVTRLAGVLAALLCCAPAHADEPASRPAGAKELIRTAQECAKRNVLVYLAYTDEWLKMEKLGIRVDDAGFTRIDRAAKPMNVATEWKDLDAFRDLLVRRLTQRR